MATARIIGKRVVDAPPARGNDGGTLTSSAANSQPEPPPKPRRRKIRRWIVLAVLVALPVWLNGPGIRWLAPVVAPHFLKNAGLEGSFRLEGSLTAGLALRDVDLKGRSTLASLRAERVSVDYSLSDLFNATVSSVGVESLHAEIDLAAPSLGGAAEKSDPFDVRKLIDTLQTVRSRVLPIGMELRDISLDVKRGDSRVVALAPSSLSHRPGDSEIHLDAGALTDANGKVWPARHALVTWNAGEVSLDRLDALPGVGLRALVVRLPASGEPSASAELHLDDAVVVVDAGDGFRSVSADLREGRVNVPEIAGRLGLEVPASGEITSLSLQIGKLLPDPLAADGAIRVLLENVSWTDWAVPEVALDLDLSGNRATVAANGRVLDTAVAIHADAALGAGPDRFAPATVSGRFKVEDVPGLLAALAARVPAIDPGIRAPASLAEGEFSLALDRQRLVSNEFSLRLQPGNADQVSPLSVSGRMPDLASVEADVALDGAKLRASYRFASGAYAGEADFDGFRSSRIDPWLAVFRAGTDGALVLSGSWKGSGDVPQMRHTGGLSLAGLDFHRKDMPPAKATARVSYDWPASVGVESLKLETAGQSIAADAALSDGFLTLSGLQWSDRGTPLATGSAKLPVPQDVSKWREMLASDTRPIAVDVESKVLSLALLKDWIPEASKLDPRSTGMLRIKATGSYQNPAVDLFAELKNLRSPELPSAPPADLSIRVAGSDARLKVDAKATAPDYPPAVLTASMPFRPADWAGHPDRITQEKLIARLDLPKLDISRFGSLVTAADQITGTLTGSVDLSGELARPAVKGRISLSNGGLSLKGGKIPPLTGAELAVDLALDKITVTKLRASMSAGTIDGSGSLGLVDFKPGPIDFRLRANQLPLMRDESLIIRSNADLRLSGTYEKASITGSVGVVNSLFFRDIELLPIGSPFTGPSAAELPKIDAARVMPGSSVPLPIRDWTLDVRARTVNPFLVRGNLATGQVEADLRIRGTVGAPAPDGLATIKDVRAALPFSTLSVHKGLLRFTPSSGFDPVLEIRGTAEPRPYRVNVFAYGPLSKPEVLLTSSPPLAEAEIMTLLATGTTTAGLEDTQAASSRAMQLVIEEFRRGRFAGSRHLRPVFRLLDRVDFSLAEADPYSGESFSTATINLTDRWYVSAGMGAEGDTRLMGIWRITFR